MNSASFQAPPAIEATDPALSATDKTRVARYTSMRYATGERKVLAPLANLIWLMIALKLDPPRVNEWLEER